MNRVNKAECKKLNEILVVSYMGSPKEQRLNEVNGTLDERAREVLGGLHVIATKTAGRQVVTKGR